MHDPSQDGADHGPDRNVARLCAPPEVWETVRHDYLAGMAATECCRRHGVGLTALRNRAAREGWRRADQPWSPPDGLDPWDEGAALDDRVGGDLDRIEPGELAWVASRRMIRAVLRGDAAEALRWRRVRMAMDEEATELERLWRRDEALRFERDGREASPPAGSRDGEVDDVDDVDGVFSAAAR